MKLLITADLHISKAEDAARLERICALAAAEGCSGLLIGGDLLDSPFPDAAAEAAILAAFAACPCPIYLVAGNHDPLELTAFYKRLPDGVHCFPAALTAYPLGEGITLYGCSAAKNQNTQPLLEGFSAPEGGIGIFLGHGQADGGANAFQPLRAEALSRSHLALAVLGHIHKGEQRMIGSCRLLVPGVPEGRGWDETGEKYVYIAEIAAEGSISIAARSIAQRIYREPAVDLSDCADTEEMLARMEAIEIPADTEARLILIGAPLAAADAAAHIYTERWGREVKDQTDPSLAVELLRSQNTLQGAFVRRALAELEAAPEEQRPQLEEALRLGLNALKEARL